MSGRPLTPSEKALWQKFVETVEPLDAERKRRADDLPTSNDKPANAAQAKPSPRSTPTIEKPAVPNPAERRLDSHWDRRLSKGAITPDVTVDLHGASLAGAHARLDSALEMGIAAGHRVLLLIAGRLRDHDRASGEGRGAIRAALSDWLAASRHAAHIAAVRRAHPRHGGAGALYIILKKRR